MKFFQDGLNKTNTPQNKMVCGPCAVGALSALGVAGALPWWCKSPYMIVAVMALVFLAVYLWRQRGAQCETCK